MTSPGEPERGDRPPGSDDVRRALEHAAASDDVIQDAESTMQQSRERVGRSQDAIEKTADALGSTETGRSVAETATDVVDEALDWLTAVGLGIRDTAKDMLDRGREGAREAYREYWQRYDEKTVLRREQPHAPSRDRKKGKKKRRQS